MPGQTRISRFKSGLLLRFKFVATVGSRGFSARPNHMVEHDFSQSEFAILLESTRQSRLQPKLRISAPVIAISGNAPRSYAGRSRSGAVQRGRSLPAGARAARAELLQAFEACAFHLVLHVTLLISFAWVRSPPNSRIYRDSDIAMSRPTKSSMCLQVLNLRQLERSVSITD